MTLSVITINYNNVSGLQKTINSVVGQVYQDFEYIVIDGGSEDGSVDLLKSCDRVNYFVSEKDSGIYDAMNKGITEAQGDYCLFLNSGDVLCNENVFLKISSALFSKKSFYYGNLILEKNNVKEQHTAPSSVDLDFIFNSTFWHPCIFIKTELFKQFGLYNTSFKICGDYEFFVRCLIKPNITTEYLNEFITLFDGNGISNDSSKSQLQEEEREKAWLLNLSPLLYQALKQQNSFSRSKYASVINIIQKLRGKQSF